jgi:hypothetical protein
MYSLKYISYARPLVTVIYKRDFCRNGLFNNAMSLEEINFLLRNVCCSLSLAVPRVRGKNK